MQLENEERTIMNHKKIRRIMKKYNLQASIRKVNRKMAKATQEHKTCPNLLQRQFDQQEQGKVSRKGNCWDNAPMESFFGHMKDELAYEKTAKIPRSLAKE